MAEYVAAGLYDPDATDADERRTLLEHLANRGATIDEMVAAAAEDRLPFVLGDRLISPGTPTMTLDEAAARVGVDRDVVMRTWRAVGFASPPRADRPAFAEADLVALRLLAAAVDEFGPEGTMEMARVVGSSLARIAETGFAVSLVRSPGGFLPRAESLIASADAAERLGVMTQASAPLFDVIFRRHVEAAIRRWTIDPTVDPEAPVLAVGFADLVGFTTLSQRMDRVALVRALTELEDLAAEVVAEHGGRVVKLIGDEVMFVAPDAASGCRLALALLAARREPLPMLRASVALGPVVQQTGDYFGPVVNVAARLVEQARAGELLVTGETAARLDPSAFAVRALAPMALKGFVEPVAAAAIAQVPETDAGVVTSMA